MHVIGTHQFGFRPVDTSTTFTTHYIVHIPYQQTVLFGLTPNGFGRCCRAGIDSVSAASPPLPETFVRTGRGSQ